MNWVLTEQVLRILEKSMPVLKDLPMRVIEGRERYSTNDSDFVKIPNLLGVVLHEQLANLKYIFQQGFLSWLEECGRSPALK